MLVPDEIKIEYLIKMKNMHNVYKINESFFLYTFKVACELGNEKLYHQSEFDEELLTLEAFKTMDKALEEYKSKNYAEAEALFLTLIESPVSKIKDDAFNNLAFMARRGEVSEKCPHFNKLIGNVSDHNIFKHMNLLLYFLHIDNYNFDKCKEGYNVIKHATEEDINALVDCWSNKSLVGEESETAMFIINSIRFYKNDLEWGVLPCSQYNIDILKAVIYEE
jgi:hypothetical protein